MDKKPHIKPYLYGMLAGFGAIALSIIFFFLIYRFDGFGSAISTLTGILMPFIYGAVIAYLLKPVCNSIENFLRRFIPEKMNGLINALSVALTILFGLLLVYALVMMIVPQLITSVTTLYYTAQANITKFMNWANHLEFIEKNEQITELLNSAYAALNTNLDTWNTWLKNTLLPSMQNIVSGAAIGVLNVVTVAKNLIIGSIVKRLRHPARTSQQRMGELVSTLDESLSGIKVIKSYNATGYVKQKFYDLSEDLARLTLSMARRQQLASPMSEFLGISAVGVILVFGGSLVFKDALSPEGFIAFIAMFSQITRPVRTFIDQFSNINQGIAAGERIFSIIDAQSEIQDKPGAIELDGLKDKIEFRDIHFSYDGSREVIEGISFEIKRGETVALVGPSGGGKSTLSELIPRFYDVKAGDILIDGVSVRDYTQDSLRAHMSVVAQDTVLFNDTIEGNIAMGKAGATHDEIVEAARIANADCFIQEAPEGYQTNIGDRGVKLSGGQRQRLSIARAVLKNPEILILDEATSALDTESEKLVQDALNKLLVGRTSVVIAHRLSTIHNADKIIVVDHGRVAEQGTHTELLAKGGIYAKLIELQSFD